MLFRHNLTAMTGTVSYHGIYREALTEYSVVEISYMTDIRTPSHELSAGTDYLNMADR